MDAKLIQQYKGRLRTHSVEVSISNTNGTYYLPDDSILRTRPVVGIFITENPSNDRKTPDTESTIPGEDAIRNSYLTLKCNNLEILENHPLIDLVVGKSDKEIRQFYLAEITPSKSYIEVADTSLISTGEAFLLHFVYVGD